VTRLVIHLDVPDDQVDPTLTDPLDLAQDVVGEYENWTRTNQGIPVEVVAAEWST